MLRQDILENATPSIIVGTPGRIKALVAQQKLKLDTLKHFVLDECDKMLEALDMRRDVQEIFRATPHSKQVMMFSATLSKQIKLVCRKFCSSEVSIPPPAAAVYPLPLEPRTVTAQLLGCHWRARHVVS